MILFLNMFKVEWTKYWEEWGFMYHNELWQAY